MKSENFDNKFSYFQTGESSKHAKEVGGVKEPSKSDKLKANATLKDEKREQVGRYLKAVRDTVIINDQGDLDDLQFVDRMNNDLGANAIETENPDIIDAFGVNKLRLVTTDPLYNPHYKLAYRIESLVNKIGRGFVDTEEQQAYLKSVFSFPIMINKEPDKHPHALLAQTRKLMEFEVTLKMYPLKILDIGSGVRSLRYGLTNVYNLMPIYSTADRPRWTKAKLAIGNNTIKRKCVCRHKLAECACHGVDKFNPDIYLSIDSSYYENVFDNIAALCVQNTEKMAYLAFHCFDTSKKQDKIIVCGKEEGDYKLTLENPATIFGYLYPRRVQVDMGVKGNAIRYTHPLHPMNDFYKSDVNAMYYTVKDNYDQQGLNNVKGKKVLCTVYRRVQYNSSAYVMVQMCFADDEDEKNNPLPIHTDFLAEFEDKKKNAENQKVIDELRERASKMPKITVQEKNIDHYNLRHMMKGAVVNIEEEENGKPVLRKYKVVRNHIKCMVFRNKIDGIWEEPDDEEYQDLILVDDLRRTVNKLLINDAQITHKTLLQCLISINNNNSVGEITDLLPLIIDAIRQVNQATKRAIDIVNTNKDVRDINAIRTNNYEVKPNLSWWEYFKNILVKLGYNWAWLSRVQLTILGALLPLLFAAMYYAFKSGTIHFAFMTTLYTIAAPFKLLDVIPLVSEWFVDLLSKMQWNGGSMFVAAMSNNEVRKYQANFLLQAAITWAGAKVLRAIRNKWNSLIRGCNVGYKSKIVEATCITEDNYKEVSGSLMGSKPNHYYNGKPRVDWKLKIPANLTKEEFLDLRKNCSNVHSKKVHNVAPVCEQAQKSVIYHVCPNNNYCASKRQCTSVPLFEKDWLNRFNDFVGEIFEREIKPLIDEYFTAQYDFEMWYNHLSATKQQEIDRLRVVVEHSNNTAEIKGLLKLMKYDVNNEYTMFVKSEKQLYSDGKAPKNRCICGASPLHKYVMGPVTYALEQVMKYQNGYCGGKSWGQLEHMYNDWQDKGFTETLQMDGSGFDRTQHQEIKDIVDCRIYRYVSKWVYHVPKDLFLEFATQKTRKVKVTHRVGKRVVSDGYFLQTGAVFSGSCDTTLMNTLRMSLYNRFVNEYILGFTFGVEYEVRSKGDDTISIYRSTIDKQLVEDAYWAVFINGKTTPSEQFEDINYGLGQIAKFLKWGGIEDIDFCSTQTVWCENAQTFKILRQLPRFLNLTAWSTKEFPNEVDGLIYCQSLFQSNLCWMANVPIYRAYNLLLLRNCSNLPIVTRMGSKKHCNKFDNILEIDMEYYYGADAKYKNYIIQEDDSEVPVANIPEVDWYFYFNRKYGLSPYDIDIIEEQIINGCDGSINMELFKFLLE